MSGKSILVGFADQGCPVADACDHVAGVDVVKVVLWPVPRFGFAVIDFEADVVRYPVSIKMMRSASLIFNTCYYSVVCAHMKWRW